MTAHNLKSIKEDFKARGVYYTPPELVELLKEYATSNPRDVYDPTCGDGALLRTFADNIPKYGQEIDPNQLAVAETIPNFTGYAGDTLSDPAFMDKRFHLIMANPPFSIKWDRQSDIRFDVAPALAPATKADYAFILHILHLLADDGKAVILNFPGIAYRGYSEGLIREWLIEQNYIERVVHIPGNTFVDTKIATLLLVLSKSKTTTDIIFEDRADGQIETISYEKIKANSYTLSPSNYLEKEEVVEDINPIELEILARRKAVRDLSNQIQTSEMLLALDTNLPPLSEFIDDIDEVLNKYR